MWIVSCCEAVTVVVAGLGRGGEGSTGLGARGWTVVGVTAPEAPELHWLRNGRGGRPLKAGGKAKGRAQFWVHISVWLPAPAHVKTFPHSP